MEMVRANKRIDWNLMARAFATVGTLTEIERFSKMVKLSDHEEIEDRYTIIKVTCNNGATRFYLVDSLNRLAYDDEHMVEMVKYLKRNGYLPEKEFQMSRGMTEEMWEEWNA